MNSLQRLFAIQTVPCGCAGKNLSGILSRCRNEPEVPPRLAVRVLSNSRADAPL